MSIMKTTYGRCAKQPPAVEDHSRRVRKLSAAVFLFLLMMSGWLIDSLDAYAAENDDITVTMDIAIPLTLSDTSEGKFFIGEGEIYAMSENPATHRFVSVTLPDAYTLDTPDGEKDAPSGTEVKYTGSMNARRGYLNYQALNGLDGKTSGDAIKGKLTVKIPFVMAFKDYGAGEYSMSIPVTLTMRKAYGSYSSDLHFTPWSKLLEDGDVTVSDEGSLSHVKKDDMILEIDPSVNKLEGNIFLDTTYTEVAIPATVTSGKDAFAQSIVETVVFDQGFTTIPSQICCNATKLVKCVVPDQVDTIESAAFFGCVLLADFSFPSALETLGSTAFAYCYKLEEFVMSRDLNFTAGLGQSSPFYKCKLKRIEVKEGVTTVQATLFYDACSELTELTLPTTLTSIGAGAFNNASKLEDLEIKSDLSKPSATPFKNSGIKNLTFSANVTCIPQSLFSNGCPKLEELDIPANITSVGVSAFSYATSLKKVTIRSDITKVGNSMSSPFYNAGIEEIVVAEGVTKIPSYFFVDGISNLKSVRLPSTLLRIENCAFKGGGAMERLELPENLTYLGASAFGSGKGIDTVVINSNFTTAGSFNAPFASTSIKHVIVSEGVTEIGTYVFQDAIGSLIDLSLPSTLQKIGDDAFYGCNYMEELSLPASITYLGAYAFGKGKGIGTVIINSDITTGGSYKYPFGNTKIEHVVISEGVASVGSYMFYDAAANIEDISFPSTLSVISDYAFSGCNTIEELSLPSGLTYLGGGAFSSGKGFGTVVINSDIRTAGSYKYPFDGTSIGHVVISDGVASIGSYMFCNAAGNIEDIRFPSTLTKIGAYAFSGCSSLTELSLPDSLVNLDRYAFEGATSLKTFTVNKIWTLDGDYSPFKNSGIETLIVVDGITKVQNKLFESGCANMTDVYLPVSVTSIGYYAFYGGDNITFHYAGTEEQWAGVTYHSSDVWRPIAVLYGEAPP